MMRLQAKLVAVTFGLVAYALVAGCSGKEVPTPTPTGASTPTAVVEQASPAPTPETFYFPQPSLELLLPPLSAPPQPSLVLPEGYRIITNPDKIVPDGRTPLKGYEADSEVLKAFHLADGRQLFYLKAGFVLAASFKPERAGLNIEGIEFVFYDDELLRAEGLVGKDYNEGDVGRLLVLVQAFEKDREGLLYSSNCRIIRRYDNIGVNTAQTLVDLVDERKNSCPSFQDNPTREKITRLPKDAENYAESEANFLRFDGVYVGMLAEWDLLEPVGGGAG